MTRKEIIDLLELDPSVLVFVLHGIIFIVGDIGNIKMKLNEMEIIFENNEKYLIIK